MPLGIIVGYAPIKCVGGKEYIFSYIINLVICLLCQEMALVVDMSGGGNKSYLG